MKWHIPIPCSPFKKNYILLQSTGGGGDYRLGYASDSGAARICQKGAKAMERSDQAGEGVGGEIFENSGKHAHEIPLLGGILCEVAYTNPLIPLSIFFIPINGGGGPCALSYANESGAAKARVTHRREIFKNSGMNTALSCTFKCLFRGYIDYVK